MAALFVTFLYFLYSSFILFLTTKRHNKMLLVKNEFSIRIEKLQWYK